MNRIFTLFIALFSFGSFAQSPLMQEPQGHSTASAPSWAPSTITKALGDSCGAYFNNYVGLSKTSILFFESLRTGNSLDFTPYSGRAQRFHAPQPIEVSGIQFYSFQTNTELDSLPVVTVMYDWNEALDSVGLELARDTVYVKHTTFSPVLSDIEVSSVFEEPITVEEDYIVGVYTFTNDSLKIITNDPSGDGDLEGVSFAYYENPFAPSFTGWYNTLSTFGPAYDIDFLINPRVKYDLHDGFSLTGDEICPATENGTCVEYEQVPVFSDPHYSSLSDSPMDHISWDWGDGSVTNDVDSTCHTYENSSTYPLMLSDSLIRYDFFDNTCIVSISDEVIVLDSTTADFTFDSFGLTVDFESTVATADSILWDFGNGSTSETLNPEQVYAESGEYEVWLYAYGPCNTDSVMYTVSIDDSGLLEETNLVDIYPNPSNSFVTLTGFDVNTTIEIRTITGALVYSEQSNSTNNVTINTTNFANGLYTIHIRTKTAQQNQKLIVQH